MNLVDRLHGSHVFPRRASKLAALLDGMIPSTSHVLDVGCGDGALDQLLLQRRPDLAIQGIDVLLRDNTLIPVAKFDGERIPYEDHCFDVVMFVDVLHHTTDPMRLLREAVRVTRRTIVLKDHFLEGPLAEARLRFMDHVGNARFGVALPFNYWPKQKWVDAYDALGLEAAAMVSHLKLYPWPLDAVFGASLHFVARLERR